MLFFNHRLFFIIGLSPLSITWHIKWDDLSLLLLVSGTGKNKKVKDVGLVFSHSIITHFIYCLLSPCVQLNASLQIL